MLPIATARPDWDLLYGTASAQQGLFTTRQAAEAGYSPQLLVHHVQAGRVVRVLRGVYRLVHFPASEHEELVVAWLWSDREGVVSHQSALALHGLSDVLPQQVHLTLPAAWLKRRLRVPPEVRLHHGDLSDAERTWFGAVPISSVGRTLADCARAGLSPEFLRQAAREALQRGLVTRAELDPVREALAPFGGLDP